MGLFDIFKKGPEDDTKKLNVYAQKMCITAIKYGSEFNKTLDYTNQSIIDLEEILDHYSKDISISKPTTNQVWSLATIFGFYLGETLLKNGFSEKGFIWGKEPSSNVPLLIKDNGAYLTPIDKVYKRLINGSVDNVSSFYKAAISHFIDAV